MDTAGRSDQVRSVARALAVLELLAEAGEAMTLAELTKELDVPKSTLLGILRTLESTGWLVDDGGRFQLGPRLLSVGASYVEFDPALARAEPVLDALVNELDETVHLGRLDGANVVYLAKRESSQALRLFSAIGRHLPAHATALGKAILATLSIEEVIRRLGRPPYVALTDNTITDQAELLAELDGTRERGWAVDNEENTQGIRCFAVAFSSRRGDHDAISYSVPRLRLTERTERRAIELLVEAGHGLSRG